jgi:predicted dehydrogenase
MFGNVTGSAPRAPFPEDGHRGSRRRFLGAGTTAAAAGVMAHAAVAAAAEVRPLRLGIVGCGGRGAGAVDDSLSVNEGVTLVAAADLHPAKCESLRKAIAAAHPGKVALDDAKMHGGLDGYKRVLDDPAVDVVLLTTSPGFRPRHIREAIEAGKHVFAEKPVCVDPAGYRICLEAHDRAVSQGLAIVTGTQYRRQTDYVGAVEQIRRGAIGDIVSATTRYCTEGIWYRTRKPDTSDVQYQLDNWMHFIWLSGDQITEQAVHNLDTINWVMGANPVSAFGSGGRFTRPEGSEMWDAMSIDYEYPGSRVVSFMCRQIPGAQSDNGSVIYGTEGTCHIGALSRGSRILDGSGKQVWEMKGSIAAAYRQEHKDLVDSIRAGTPIVELRQTADSSLVAVLGRLAAYTGRLVTFDFLANQSQLDLFPADLRWDGALPPPRHAVPGRTKLI